MSTETLLLRDAAGLMRERARAACPGPWFTSGESAQYGGLVAAPCDDHPEDHGYDGHLIGESMSTANREHVAGWHPAVALAVADWLDQEADHLEVHIPAWTRPSSGVDDPPGLCWNDPERLAEVVEHHYGRALAVARAYVGGVA